MSKSSRISAIHDLGQFFKLMTENELNEAFDGSKFENLARQFPEKIHLAEIHNPWFTKENILYALAQWGELLNRENLEAWTAELSYAERPKKVGIIMAGNLPLVGFHDLISVLVSGHEALIKTSSKDDILMSFVVDFLQTADEGLKTGIQKVERLKNQDAVIATGSNNTARYFEYYFKDQPHIIRRNRTSVAVIQGDENEVELKELAKDIFQYFGLGCRNVTKLYLPKGFNTDLLFEAFYEWNGIINHTKYANNYDYNRAIYLMEQQAFLDNNFVMLREFQDLHSPIGVVHYEFYEDLNLLKGQLAQWEDQIQCRVGHDFEVGFGQTQSPKLDDYADGVDVLKFLQNLD